MNWRITTASVLGINHETTKRNNQDWYGTYEGENVVIGVVCDGCGSGDHSEVGSALLGNLVLNTLKGLDITDYSIHALKTYLESKIFDFIELLTLGYDIESKIRFIKHYMLTTILFCVICDQVDEFAYIGISGDGITACNTTQVIHDESNAPNYIAYRNLPKEVLNTTNNEIGFTINHGYIFEPHVPYQCIIATDGVTLPLDELYGHSGRQLQRKFNVLQRKSRTFSDDATCIIMERNES